MNKIKDMSVLNVLKEFGLNGNQLKIVLASLDFDVNKTIKELTQEDIINLFAINNIDVEDIGE